ncbi:MAG: ROK family protein, partial [Propionibacteriaceae bacterium]|nr:ROK family protein [Propionibacteriaceae bacterium]
ARIGAGQAYGRWLYVTIGTGVSGCVVVDGVPEPGTRGFAVHLANNPIRTPCVCCGRPSSQTLEDVASGRGIVQTAVAAGADVTRVEEVLRRGKEGDFRLAEIVLLAGRAMGSGIALAVNSTDPEAVVLGGGLGQARGPYRDALEQTLREDIIACGAKGLPVLRAAAGSDSGVIGSGFVALRPRAGSGLCAT